MLIEFVYTRAISPETGQHFGAPQVPRALPVQEVRSPEGLPAWGLHHVAQDRRQVAATTGMAGA